MLEMPNRCGHCGREGTLETKGSVILSSQNQMVQSTGFQEEIEVQRIAQVDRCSSCGEVTVSRYLWIDQYFDPQDIEAETLYPQPHQIDDLPPNLRTRYEAMLELQHAPDAFAVRAGRVLEAICADREISDELPLREQLNALIDQADVPKPLVSQAHVVYTYRNYGGHIKEFEVEERDVPLIRGFVDALLDFLYRGPAELARASTALENRKAAAMEQPD